MSTANPGWYPDPTGTPGERYWDGRAWTDQTRALPPPPVGAVPMNYSIPGVAPRNGTGTAALTLGLLGISLHVILSMLIFIFAGIITALGILATPLPIVLSVLAIIFGGIGLGRANRGEATNKGAAATGLVLGIIGIAVGVINGVAWFS